jgi:hypothetical protein
MLWLMPSATLSITAYAKSLYVLEHGPKFWDGARAGEQQALGTAYGVVELLRRTGITEYTPTKAFVQDSLRHQRTVEGAWPLRPVRSSRFVLALESEELRNCQIIDSSVWVKFCVRR